MANGGKPVRRGVAWRERETLDLLSIWGEEAIQKALVNNFRNTDVFDWVATQMAALGHKRSAVECRTKTKALKHKYNRAGAHSYGLGNAPATCPFYWELDRILRGDASSRPPQVARGSNLQVLVVDPPQNQECTPRPEELFSFNLETIKQEDMHHFTSLDSGESSSALSQDPDETLINQGAEAEEGVPPDIGETGNQGDQDGGNGTTLQQDQDAQGKICDAAPPSPETRLSAARNRNRHVSLLSDVAWQMVRQSALDAERSQQLQKEILLEERRCHQENLVEERRRHEQMLSEENRRYEALLEESRLEREAFQCAADRSCNLMFEAVTAIKTMTGLMMLKHSGQTPPVGNIDVLHENTNNPELSTSSASQCSEKIPHAPSKHRQARRTVDRLDL
ncbi:uncharacterized protein LOC125437395 isoform X2 [Sphaerodactylus townsendi]|uniref:uncharacterized protein LOC125437395 isoform X2 n=1 Tax=Sphaerodactylus townsendi TaxID=933632 RepID=UPI00202667F0|nr:uncharacterized protein LOC125437395 isoform X2 [Sphaerodactylus townsendi]